MKEYTINDYVREECERDPAFREAWEAEAPARALALSMRRERSVGGRVDRTAYQKDRDRKETALKNRTWRSNGVKGRNTENLSGAGAESLRK